MGEFKKKAFFTNLVDKGALSLSFESLPLHAEERKVVRTEVVAAAMQ